MCFIFAAKNDRRFATNFRECTRDHKQIGQVAFRWQEPVEGTPQGPQRNGQRARKYTWLDFQPNVSRTNSATETREETCKTRTSRPHSWYTISRTYSRLSKRKGKQAVGISRKRTQGPQDETRIPPQTTGGVSFPTCRDEEGFGNYSKMFVS